METEDYVSPEVARMLQRIGFDEPCQCFFKGGELYEYFDERKKYWPKIDEFPAPTLYQAQKWLRKEKGIYLWVEPVVCHKWSVSFSDLNVSPEESDWLEREIHRNGYRIYSSFEEALNIGIQQALLLI